MFILYCVKPHSELFIRSQPLHIPFVPLCDYFHFSVISIHHTHTAIPIICRISSIIFIFQLSIDRHKHALNNNNKKNTPLHFYIYITFRFYLFVFLLFFFFKRNKKTQNKFVCAPFCISF